MRTLITLIVSIFLIILLTSCGDIDDCIIEGNCGNPPDQPTPTVSAPLATPKATPTKTPVKPPTPFPMPTAGQTNPVCIGVADSRAHLLWKPVSDTTGNAVMVFDGKYKKEFRGVKAELKDGKFEQAFYKPLVLFGNPDSVGPRQHWRTKRKCRDFKDKALIIVDDTTQQCSFRLPGDPCKRWE